MTVFAHSIADAPKQRWEQLREHLVAVGAKASTFGSYLDIADMARAAGLLHDIGKRSAAFQARLEGGPPVDHSTAGAIEAMQRYDPLLGRLLAFAIAGHHAGLADGKELRNRLARTDLADYSGWEAETGPLPDITPPPFPFKEQLPYSAAFLGRMLFSCLVDADFLATEAFYGAKERGGHSALATLRERLNDHLTNLTGRAPRSDLNLLRAEILAHARAKAEMPPGLFTMTVPTGGGKTLASLAFALDHAVRHGLRRIVYIIPYTSIIEQTAGVFRRALGDTDVLEHHGNVEWERPAESSIARADDEGRDASNKLRRAAENWDVPIVVTTAVQFFESLHAARTSRCRKLHNLAKSAIILDEAQTLPVHLLRPCLAAIDELTGNYGASVVLCTATQPAVTQAKGFSRGLRIGEDRELAPRPRELYDELRRTDVRHAGTVTDADIAARFAEREQMLCIVNSRKHAQALFGEIADMPGARHLTTLMCPAHRRAVLTEIRRDLAEQRPVRLVATSLIEAGVDVDFPEVWRAETGLDSIAQAAGRCNREGKLKRGEVVVFDAADHSVPPVFKQPIAAMRAAMRGHEADPLGLDAVETYFRELYWTKGDSALDAAKLGGKPFPILPAIAERGVPPFDFPYRSIADAFRMIDDVMDPVIVPWRGADGRDEVPDLLERLRTAKRPPGDVLRRLQQFTVSIPTTARAAMLATGAVQAVLPAYGERFVHLVADSLYSGKTGLSLDPFGMDAKAGIF